MIFIYSFSYKHEYSTLSNITIEIGTSYYTYIDHYISYLTPIEHCSNFELFIKATFLHVHSSTPYIFSTQRYCTDWSKNWNQPVNAQLWSTSKNKYMILILNMGFMSTAGRKTGVPVWAARARPAARGRRGSLSPLESAPHGQRQLRHSVRFWLMSP